MNLYNTLTHSIEEFVPLDPARRRVGMYVCGPTVYDVPHIGHARSAYLFDVLRRYLEHQKFQVRFVRNVTDVDDKIIHRAQEELGAAGAGPGAGEDLNAKCAEVAERSLASYHQAMDRLGLGRPTDEPRATAHVVPDMTDFISQLLIKGVAYEAGGDVYFSVRQCAGYGRLSNRTVDELLAGARVEPGEGKRDPADFALWKAAKPGEPSWKSPWGEGRPGWHIECSVMSTKYLGDAFDIHGGGVDLVFPHHENELAQALALGKPFARYWVHNGLLTVNGEKMSKSIGNFVTVDQVLNDCDQDSDLLKMFFLSTHYRSPIDYTKARVALSKQRYRNYLFLMRIARPWMRSAGNEVAGAGGSESFTPIAEAEPLKQAFFSALDDDLNTPQALSALDGMRRWGSELHADYQRHRLHRDKLPADERNTPELVREDGKLQQRFLVAVSTLKEHGNLLGLSFKAAKAEGDVEQATKRLYVEQLFKDYKAAREKGDYNTSDAIRKRLNEKGYIVQDTGKNSSII